MLQHDGSSGFLRSRALSNSNAVSARLYIMVFSQKLGGSDGLEHVEAIAKEPTVGQG